MYHRDICSVCRRNNPTLIFIFMAYYLTVTKSNTTGVSLVEQQRVTFPEHLDLPLDFSGVCDIQSLAFCVVSCLSFYNFSFDHCIVSPWNYGIILPIWYMLYLQLNVNTLMLMNI